MGMLENSHPRRPILRVVLFIVSQRCVGTSYISGQVLRPEYGCAEGSRRLANSFTHKNSFWTFEVVEDTESAELCNDLYERKQGTPPYGWHAHFSEDSELQMSLRIF